MTVLIKNGLVYDGSGEPPVRRNLLIDRGIISRVDAQQSRHADRVIDAANAIVAPGFIDINTSSDHHLSLFSSPEQRSFIGQGVTSIIGGACGVSLAPLLGFPLDRVVAWGHPTHLNTNWGTMGQFLDALDQLRLGVNFGTLVGFSGVRRLLVGDERRDLSTPERALMLRIIERALHEGAFGFSTGADTAGTGHIPATEIEEVARLTARAHGVYAVHVRDVPTSILASVQGAIDIANRTHVHMELSHFMPMVGETSKYLDGIAAIEKAAGSSSIHFDVYPFDTVERPAVSLLPAWAHRADDVLTDERVRTHVGSLDLIDVRIGHLFEPSLRFLEGKRLSEFASDCACTPHEAFLRILSLSRLRATIISRSVDRPTLEKLMTSQAALIASNSAGLDPVEFSDDRGRATFTTFLAWAEQSKSIPLEQAIARITSIPASLYRLAKRGRIAETYHADIVILRDLKPTTVFVNGAVALEDGAFTGVRSGTALRARTHA
jgi:N-acyl-D-amino-acid deacylase